MSLVCVELSAEGEQYVDEEIKRALLGVKRVREVMEKKEEKHRHLMDALRHSSDKKEVSIVPFVAGACKPICSNHSYNFSQDTSAAAESSLCINLKSIA